MNKDYLQNIAEALLDTFFKAGDVAKEIAHKGIKITIKEDNSPVTNGDLAVDKMLKEKINKLTPEIPMISEETVNLEIKNKNKENTYDEKSHSGARRHDRSVLNADLRTDHRFPAVASHLPGGRITESGRFP